MFSLIAAILVFSAPKASAFESPMKTIADIVSASLSQTSQGDDSGKNDKSEGKDVQEKNSNIPQPVNDPKEIEKAAEFASNATGVRKDFLMGMLVVESDLGRNPGKCTYQEVEQGAQDSHEKGRLSSRAWQTFQERRDIMKDIANSLGYDYEKLQVSCNPGSAYAGTGGAMGIPQFMPSTWLEYKDRVSAIVKKDNPDPWNIQDGAVAMALKLSDVYGVTDHSQLAERNASKMYLSGSTSYYYEWYANQAQYWAKNYHSLLG